MEQRTWQLLKDTKELIDIFSENPEVEAMRKRLKGVDEYHDNVITFLCIRLKRDLMKAQQIDHFPRAYEPEVNNPKPKPRPKPKPKPIGDPPNFT